MKKLIFYITFCFNSLLIQAEETDSFVKKLLKEEIITFVSAQSNNPGLIIVNLIGFDSLKIDSIPLVNAVYTSIEWSPYFNNKIEDTIQVLYIKKIQIDEGSFKIIFQHKEIIFTDKKAMLYKEYTYSNYCFPIIFLLN